MTFSPICNPILGNPELQILSPSLGHTPPPRGSFPWVPLHLPIKETPEPSEEDFTRDLGPNWELDQSLSLEDRWLSLCNPPDYVATDIATSGVKLTWLKDPPPLSPRDQCPQSVITSKAKLPVLLPLVQNWMDRGILTTTQIPAFVYFSRLFYVDKKNGNKRPVLDLSRLNLFILTPSFVMETLEKVLEGVVQSMWATSLDVTDAFLSVAINLEFQKYFCFMMNGVVYMFLRMPFGLTTAPWVFSRIMRPIKNCLRLKGVIVNSFIDDFIIMAITSALTALHTRWTENLLVYLGFQINQEKSSKVPVQQIEYLGILLNLRTLTLALPADKVLKILNLTQVFSQRITVTRRELESLVGFLNFAHPLIPLGRMHVLPLIQWMNSHTSPQSRDKRVFTNSLLKQALNPFRDPKFLQVPVSFQKFETALDIMTDASEYAWSGVAQPFRIQDFWTPWERSQSINWKEIKAIYYTVLFCRDSLSGRAIRVLTDSMVAVYCLKRMGSLRSPTLSSLLRELLLLCHDHSIVLVPAHIEGSLNVLADQGSRIGPFKTEWCLDPDSFSWIFQQFPCCPEVDLFATRANSRFPAFVSAYPDPKAVFWDARSQDWNDFFKCIYAFPPPEFLPQVIHRIVQFSGTGILVAPLNQPRVLHHLVNRCSGFVRLPKDSSLFQILNGDQIVTQKAKFWDLAIWIL